MINSIEKNSIIDFLKSIFQNNASELTPSRCSSNPSSIDENSFEEQIYFDKSFQLKTNESEKSIENKKSEIINAYHVSYNSLLNSWINGYQLIKNWQTIRENFLEWQTLNKLIKGNL